jgi:hypothetical protein
MWKLTISSNLGTTERPNFRQMEFGDDISESLLARFFLCSPEDIKEVAVKMGIRGVEGQTSSGGNLVVRYPIDNAFQILHGLKEKYEEAKAQDVSWLVAADLGGEDVTLKLPSGSELKFSKN